MQERKVVITLVALLLEDCTNGSIGLEIKLYIIDVSRLEEIDDSLVSIGILYLVFSLDNCVVDTRSGVNLQLHIAVRLHQRVAEIVVVLRR